MNQTTTQDNKNIFRIGIVSISDRASEGTYQDKGLPTLMDWLAKVVLTPYELLSHLIPDQQSIIEDTLRKLVDENHCGLVITTGGTGPSPRDVTPEATLAIADKILPGFGEQMRQISLRFVPTAILSRQVGVIRKQSLIFNLPGQPKSICETLEGIPAKNGMPVIPGIFAAVPYCLELIGAGWIDTNEDYVKAFRPKSAEK